MPGRSGVVPIARTGRGWRRPPATGRCGCGTWRRWNGTGCCAAMRASSTTSPSSRTVARIASAAWDNSVRLWDVTTGRQTALFKGPGRRDTRSASGSGRDLRRRRRLPAGAGLEPGREPVGRGFARQQGAVLGREGRAIVGHAATPRDRRGRPGVQSRRRDRGRGAGNGNPDFEEDYRVCLLDARDGETLTHLDRPYRRRGWPSASLPTADAWPPRAMTRPSASGISRTGADAGAS